MPSKGVPSVRRYQRVTMSTPSGLSDGTSRKIVFCEDGAEAGRVFGQQPVGELDGGLGGCQLGRVDRTGDQDDGLAFGDQLFGFVFRSQARIGQAALDFPVAVEVLQGFGRSDGGGDEGPAFGALAQLFHADPVSCRIGAFGSRRRLSPSRAPGGRTPIRWPK